jgi:hypothetical protein
MGQKNKHNNYSFESEIDGHADYDPNFNLDEYINRMSREGQIPETHTVVEEDDRSQFKNAVLIFLVFAASYLWINDWSIGQAWNNIFGNDEVTFVTAPEVPSVDIPTIPAIPENPMAPGEVAGEGFVEFLAAANASGLNEYYSNIGLQTMYEAGVTIEYLNQLSDAGITDQSFPAVIAFYESEVSMDYLSTLNEAGFLQTQSFPAVIAFNESGVTMEYLNELNQAGYLQISSFPAVVAYYEAGVTPEFLDQLNENGLLQQMSFPDVVNAFEADN